MGVPNVFLLEILKTPKTNECPLKNVGLEYQFPFEMIPFHVTFVHFRGGILQKKQRKQPRLESSGNSGAFSVTPTLDAHEAAVFALNDYEAAAEAPKVGEHCSSCCVRLAPQTTIL